MGSVSVQALKVWRCRGAVCICNWFEGKRQSGPHLPKVQPSRLDLLILSCQMRLVVLYSYMHCPYKIPSLPTSIIGFILYILRSFLTHTGSSCLYLQVLAPRYFTLEQVLVSHAQLLDHAYVCRCWRPATPRSSRRCCSAYACTSARRPRATTCSSGTWRPTWKRCCRSRPRSSCCERRPRCTACGTNAHVRAQRCLWLVGWGGEGDKLDVEVLEGAHRLHRVWQEHVCLCTGVTRCP